MKTKFSSALLCLNLGVFAAPMDTTALKDISIGFLGQTIQIKADTTTAIDSLALPAPISIPAVEKAVQVAPNVYTVYFQGGGFVTLSMDNIARPILAYSLNGTTPDSSFNEAFDSLIYSYSSDIEKAKTSGISDPQIEAMWDDLQKYIGISGGGAAGGAFDDSLLQNMGLLYANGEVGPLLSTIWDQGGGWNMYAPAASGGPGGKAYAGCVATAMSQIMRFWSFPSSGVGSRNGINFALAQYAWDSMPNQGYTSATATLLRHAGAAVDMSYGAKGSGAYTWKAANAYKDYFRYKSSATYVQKQSYSATNWENLIKTEIDGGRPVQYEGFGSGGHAFVLDGYNSSNYFHFNFGWSGHGNGWYALSGITPSGMNFTNSQGAIVGIQPGTYTKSKALSVAGIRATGVAYASGDMASLSKLEEGASFTARNSALVKYVVMDVDGDGYKDDILGSTAKGVIMYMTDFKTPGTWIAYTGTYKAYAPADLNGDGKDDDLVAVSTLGVVWTKTKGSDIKITTGKVNSIASGDLDAGGKNNDLIGIDAAYAIQSSTDGGATWSKMNIGTLFAPRAINTYDTDGDGSRDAISVIDSYKNLWVYTGSAWTKIGTGLTQVWSVDLNGDGSANDFIGLTSTGAIMQTSNGGANWTTSTLTGFKQVILADVDGSGGANDLIAVNASSTITVIPNGNFTKTFKAPISAVQISMIDLDGNGSAENLIARASNGTFSYTDNISGVWLGNSLDLASGTFDDVGSNNDLIGIAYDGTLFKGLNGHEWSRVSPPVSAVDLAVGDFNGDGVKGEVVIAGANGKIYWTNNLSSWDSLSTIGFNKVSVGDMDSDGKFDDIIGITKTYNVFVSKDLDTLLIVASSMKSAVAIDLDGDGNRDDMVGVNLKNQVRYTSDYTTWTLMPGVYPYVEGGDFDGDGKYDDLVALTSTGISYVSTNLTTWTLANGKGFKTITSTDLDGEDLSNDLVAQDGSGNIWYSKDRMTWTQIPGLFKFFAIGDFTSLLDANGSLQPESAIIEQNTPIQDQKSSLQQLQVSSTKESLLIKGLSNGNTRVTLYNSQGKIVLETSAIAKNNQALISTNLAEGIIYGLVLGSDDKILNFQTTVLP